MKLLIMAVMMCSLNLYAQVNQPNTQQLSQNMMNDQPEPMIANSLIFRKYDQVLFEEAQKKGKPILVIVSKSDCPGCRTQAPTLQKILKSDEYKQIEIFQIDFINQPELAKKFNAPGWTMLLAFKGSSEVKRTMSILKPSEIRDFLKILL